MTGVLCLRAWSSGPPETVPPALGLADVPRGAEKSHGGPGEAQDSAGWPAQGVPGTGPCEQPGSQQPQPGDSNEGAVLLKLWDVGREPRSRRQWDRLDGNGPGTLHGQRGCHLASVA